MIYTCLLSLISCYKPPSLAQANLTLHVALQPLHALASLLQVYTSLFPSIHMGHLPPNLPDALIPFSFCAFVNIHKAAFLPRTLPHPAGSLSKSEASPCLLKACSFTGSSANLQLDTPARPLSGVGTILGPLPDSRHSDSNNNRRKQPTSLKPTSTLPVLAPLIFSAASWQRGTTLLSLQFWRLGLTKSLPKVTELGNVKAGIQMQVVGFPFQQDKFLVQAAFLLSRHYILFIFASATVLNSAPSNCWINSE